MLVIEAYQSACAGLVANEYDVSAAALSASRGAMIAAQEVHRRAVQVLAAWMPKGPQLGQIVGLQRTATEYERMGTLVGRMAEASMRLPASAERLLAQVRPDTPDLFIQIIRETYVLLRASLLVTARHDRALALHLLNEYGALVTLHTRLRQLFAGTAQAHPQFTAAVQQLTSIAEQLALLAESSAAIARSAVQTIL